MDDQLQRLMKIANVEQMTRISNAVAKAVTSSVKLRPMVGASILEPSVTRDEYKRRVEWCITFAMDRMRDDGWAPDRVCDTIGTYLLDFLDTKKIIIPKGGMWTAQEE